MSYQVPVTAGPAIDEALAAIVFVHGRGASAEDMLDLYERLEVPWCAAIAPRAPGNTWYPHSFLAPLEANQPYLDLSLAHLDSVVKDLTSRGISMKRIAFLGFSQGACLSVEFAARFPRPYGAVIGLTGGLIGPAGTPRDYPGTLHGTAVFLGAGDPDPHVPFTRVQETRHVLSAMGASVELRRYPGMGHTINEDELDACGQLLQRISPNGGNDGR